MKLPKKPDGFTKELIMHMNFGPKGGAAQYKIKNAAGKEMPFCYQYDTRKEAEVAVRNLPNIYRGKLKILRISKQIDQNSNTPAKQNGS